MEPARVLIAEPDPAVRQSLVRALEERGLEATAVEDARAVFECVRDGRYDVVVLDLDLPGADPGEMMECLAAIDPRPIAVGINRDGDRAAEQFDGALVPMTVPLGWDSEALADILTCSVRDHDESRV